MDEQEIVKIKAMIRLDLLEEATDALILLLKNQPLERDALQLAGQLSNLNRQDRNLLVDTKEARIERNKIRNALEGTLAEAQKIWETLHPRTPSASKGATIIDNDSLLDKALQWLCFLVFTAAIVATGYALFFTDSEIPTKLLQSGGSMAFGAGSLFAYFRLRVLQLATLHVVAGKSFHDVQNAVKLLS